MNNTFIFLLMIFCHIIADFNLQGWLASAKQKKFWVENAPDKLYKNDYICALLVHSFSWTFMVMLPIAYAKGFVINFDFVYFVIWNIMFHALVDDGKANQKKFSLVEDQVLHLVQIIVTFLFLIIYQK